MIYFCNLQEIKVKKEYNIKNNLIDFFETEIILKNRFF